MTAPWPRTQEKITQLAALFDAGQTYKQAAAALGVSLRNVEYYAALLRTRQREEARASADIDWPTPAEPRLPVTHWTDRAVCFGHHTLFHAGHGERLTDREIREAKAKSLCARCPVRTDCLTFAEGTGQQHGVWAGLGEDDRARIKNEERNERRRVAARAASPAAEPAALAS